MIAEAGRPRLSLCIGNAHYSNSPLSNPCNDASGMIFNCFCFKFSLLDRYEWKTAGAEIWVGFGAGLDEKADEAERQELFDQGEKFASENQDCPVDFVLFFRSWMRIWWKRANIGNREWVSLKSILSAHNFSLIIASKLSKSAYALKKVIKELKDASPDSALLVIIDACRAVSKRANDTPLGIIHILFLCKY